MALVGNFSPGRRSRSGPRRAGQHAPFRGEEIGVIVSSSLPKRTVRTAKRCHWPEG